MKKVPRFIAVHTMPMSEAEAIESAERAKEIPAGITWKLTYCGFADNKFFCEWEAPNKEAIEQFFRAANMPFDAIYPVRLLNVAKAELEA